MSRSAVLALCILAPCISGGSGDAVHARSRRDDAAHIFTGAVTKVLAIERSRRYALILVDHVEKGSLCVDNHASVEYDCADCADVQLNEHVRCFVDANFELLSPGGFEVLSRAAEAEDEQQQEQETPEQDPSALLALSYLHATRDQVKLAYEERHGLAWPEVLKLLRDNWLTSRYLREQRPLEPPSRHGLSDVVCLARDVTPEECRWLDRRFTAGERFRVYRGHTYGVISPGGVAVQHEDDPDDAPFVELPASALRNVKGAGQADES